MQYRRKTHHRRDCLAMLATAIAAAAKDHDGRNDSKSAASASSQQCAGIAFLQYASASERAEARPERTQERFAPLLAICAPRRQLAKSARRTH